MLVSCFCKQVAHRWLTLTPECPASLHNQKQRKRAESISLKLPSASVFLSILAKVCCNYWLGVSRVVNSSFAGPYGWKVRQQEVFLLFLTAAWDKVAWRSETWPWNTTQVWKEKCKMSGCLPAFCYFFASYEKLQENKDIISEYVKKINPNQNNLDL